MKCFIRNMHTFVFKKPFSWLFFLVFSLLCYQFILNSSEQEMHTKTVTIGGLKHDNYKTQAYNLFAESQKALQCVITVYLHFQLKQHRSPAALNGFWMHPNRRLTLWWCEEISQASMDLFLMSLSTDSMLKIQSAAHEILQQIAGYTVCVFQPQLYYDYFCTS